VLAQLAARVGVERAIEPRVRARRRPARGGCATRLEGTAAGLAHSGREARVTYAIGSGLTVAAAAARGARGPARCTDSRSRSGRIGATEAGRAHTVRAADLTAASAGCTRPGAGPLAEGVGLAGRTTRRGKAAGLARASTGDAHVDPTLGSHAAAAQLAGIGTHAADLADAATRGAGARHPGAPALARGARRADAAGAAHLAARSAGRAAGATTSAASAAACLTALAATSTKPASARPPTTAAPLTRASAAARTSSWAAPGGSAGSSSGRATAAAAAQSDPTGSAPAATPSRASARRPPGAGARDSAGGRSTGRRAACTHAARGYGDVDPRVRHGPAGAHHPAAAGVTPGFAPARAKVAAHSGVTRRTIHRGIRGRMVIAASTRGEAQQNGKQGQLPERPFRRRQPRAILQASTDISIFHLSLDSVAVGSKRGH
jgi:hypothetical protein